MEPGKILIVDDEANIRRGLRAILTKDGHDVQEASSADEALLILETFQCETAIVDIRMPGMTGDMLLSEIRTRWPTISVILLTGHGTLETAITAVRQGAFDYLLKPAQPDEIRKTVASALASARQSMEQSHLFATIQGSLERMGQLPTTDRASQSTTRPETDEERFLRARDLVIDLHAYEVRRDGEPISLTPSEFQLLVALARRAGQVIDYVTLVRQSLDYEAESWEAKELIKRHVFSLRQKIEPEPSAPCYVLNVRGVGYRLAS